MGDDEMVLDRAHVVVVDRVRGHEAAGVELQGSVVKRRLLHHFSRGGLQHLLADLHATGGVRKGGEREGRRGWRESVRKSRWASALLYFATLETFRLRYPPPSNHLLHVAQILLGHLSRPSSSPLTQPVLPLLPHLPPGSAHWLVPGSLLRWTKRYSRPIFRGRARTTTTEIRGGHGEGRFRPGARGERETRDQQGKP